MACRQLVMMSWEACRGSRHPEDGKMWMVISSNLTGAAPPLDLSVSQESLEIPCSLSKYAYASLLPAVHACQLAEGETEQGKGSAGSSLGTQMCPAF